MRSAVTLLSLFSCSLKGLTAYRMVVSAEKNAIARHAVVVDNYYMAGLHFLKDKRTAGHHVVRR